MNPAFRMTTTADPLDFATARAAADWFALLRSDQVDDADRQRWRAWLNADPQHRRAWSRVEAIGRQFERLPAGPVRETLAAAGRGRRQAMKTLALLCSTGALTWSVARLTPWTEWNADLRTGVGERRQRTLADGTQLWVNTATAVDANYSAALRRIVLHDGEVLIESAADSQSPSRPLIVDTTHGRVRAIGTRFNVWHRKDATRVAVFAGVVEISPADGGVPLRLAAGQQSRFDRSGVAAARPADPNREAWSRGMLLADNMRLADFLAELGRYRRGYLGCDPAIAELRLVGAYPLVDTDRVLAALEDTLPVRRHSPLPWWTTIEAVGR